MSETTLLRNVLPDKLPATLEGQTALFEQMAPDPPDAVPGWLGRLALLYGVPFENLVADIRMLPAESMRYFYLDVNWIESAVDGALSTGVHSDRDIRFDRLLRTRISKITQEAANSIRSELRGERSPDAAPDRIAAGFLMRSAVVSGWPGLEVAGYIGTDENDNAKIPLLRMERLSPDVLLVIFASVPAMVVVNQPKETFHFGIHSIQSATRNLTTFASQTPGVGPLPFRDSTPEVRNLKVLDVGKLRDRIRSLVSTDGNLGAAKFAIEMVDSAGKFRFTLGDE